MIFIYRLLFLPLMLLALPKYLSRMIKRGGYMAMMRGRFGLGKNLGFPLPGTRRIWVHAVSVGELQAIKPVIEDLARMPDTEVVLTVTTSTAYALANDKLKTVCVDIRPFPLDFWAFSAAAWRRIRPNLCILMEGELWPEHIHQAYRRNVPILVANARLSDRSWRRYSKVMTEARSLIFRRLSLILVGNEQDTERFEQLGLRNVRYAGQLKCDMPVEPRLDAAQRTELRAKLFPEIGPDTIVMLGSSTWPGEEEFLICVLGEARKTRDVRLLLVPRHAERGGDVALVLEACPFSWHRRSLGRDVAEKDLIVHLADTTGELRVLTQAADFAFIGKSLPPQLEGQSPIEAAALGVPSVMGPGMSNFRDISRSLVDAGASKKARDAEEASQMLLNLAGDADLRKKMSADAVKWFESQRGAKRITMESIEELYNLPKPTIL
jgi:3-deoxy-D-manno-octulosonic-acid transferase